VIPVGAVVAVIVILVILGIITAARSFKVIQQYEKGIIYRFGQVLPEIRGPGLHFIRPVGDRMAKVNMQIIAMAVPAQDGITRDNVTVRVDAVVYFRVVDPVKATVNVQNYMFAISQQAQTSLRSIIGQSEMDQLLAERDTVNRELRRIIDEPTEGPWGIRVERVEIKDVSLPESMKRSMSRQAEAERERRARIITADGEYQASKRLAAAANVMARDPAALQLRLLQTVVEVAAEKNSTLVMPVPVELLRFFDKLTPPAPAGGGKSAADSASLADFGNEDIAAEEAQIESGAPLELKGLAKRKNRRSEVNWVIGQGRATRRGSRTANKTDRLCAVLLLLRPHAAVDDAPGGSHEPLSRSYSKTGPAAYQRRICKEPRAARFNREGGDHWRQRDQ
jgi:regulator of protease activity HflC (stomatin/prohibitin superfamily)